MVQALVNNLNNLQEMIESKTSQFAITNNNSKFNNFNNILTDNLDKSNNSTQIAKFNQTRANSELSESEKYFKDVLKKAQQEARNEKSLDLTLAKDINDVISQFKDFIESATEEGEIVIDKNMLEKIKNGSLDDEIEMIFAQVMTMANTQVTQNSILAEDLVALKEQLTQLFETMTAEAETAEKVAEAVADKIAKTLEDITQDIDNTLDENILNELNIESIEAETASTGGESLLNGQSAEEQGLKAMLSQEAESFDIKIEKAINTQNSQASQIRHTEMTPSRILEQISRQLENMQTNSKVNIVLNPESLGRVNIQLLSTKSGLVAQFTASTAEARDLLMKGLDGLKDSLLSHGVAVDNVAVKLNETQESEYNADWTEQEGSRGGNKGQGQPNREEKEKGLFETMFTQAFNDENGNV